MNDEIKEILDRLERIDHKEDSCGFEFADSATFDEMARCFEERKVFANYITNLQQENERLNKQVVIMEKYLELIYDIGFDYDGCGTIEGLKELIDDLVHCASLGRACNTTESIYMNMGTHYNILHEEIEKKEDLLSSLQNGSDSQ